MLRQFPTLRSAAAYEIQTAGYGPDNVMAPGGVVNLASRSGSNRFEFELTASAENSGMRLFTDKLDPQNGDYFYIVNPMVSGPIIKDRLWYSLNAEVHTQKTSRPRDVEGIQLDPLPLSSLFYKGTFKLTWQITPRNKLQSVSNFDHYFPINNTDGFGVPRESQTRAISFKYFTGLIWESLLSDSIVFRSQLGLVSTTADYYPNRCRRSRTCATSSRRPSRSSRASRPCTTPPRTIDNDLRSFSSSTAWSCSGTAGTWASTTCS